MPTLTEIEQIAKQEFLLKSGTRVFDIPTKQLFEHSPAGTLQVCADAQANRKEIAKLALAFKGCERRDPSHEGVSLRNSLHAGENGATLIRATGSKFMSAITIDQGKFKMTGHILYMDLKPRVLPDDIIEVFDSLRIDTSKAIYLELICASAKSGAATLLLLCLLKKLDGAKTGILADALNPASDAFFKKFGFEHIKESPSIWWMSKATAQRLAADGLTKHLRVPKPVQAMCTRHGVSSATRRRQFWDCR
jgi:hypothetical protein